MGLVNPLADCNAVVQSRWTRIDIRECVTLKDGAGGDGERKQFFLAVTAALIFAFQPKRVDGSGECALINPIPELRSARIFIAK